MSWEKMLCIKYGNFVQEKHVDDDSVCSQSEYFNLAISFKFNQRAAASFCDSLGHGQMTAASSEEEFKIFYPGLK